MSETMQVRLLKAPDSSDFLLLVTVRGFYLFNNSEAEIMLYVMWIHV